MLCETGSVSGSQEWPGLGVSSMSVFVNRLIKTYHHEFFGVVLESGLSPSESQRLLPIALQSTIYTLVTTGNSEPSTINSRQKVLDLIAQLDVMPLAARSGIEPARVELCLERLVPKLLSKLSDSSDAKRRLAPLRDHRRGAVNAVG